MRALVPISLVVIAVLLIKGIFTPANAVPIHVCFYNYGSEAAHWSLRFQKGNNRNFSLEPGRNQRHQGDSVGTVCVSAEPFKFPACPNSRSQKDFQCD